MNPCVLLGPSGGIQERLVDSERFSHEKGAFTGAVARKVGKFSWAVPCVQDGNPASLQWSAPGLNR